MFIFMTFVLCGCETWSLTVRECSLKVLENRLLKKEFVPKREV